MTWKLSRFLVVACALMLGPAAVAQTGSQLPNPRLFTLMPCGGRAGSTLTVTFSGTDVEEPQSLVFSHPGIHATAIIPPKPKADPKKPAPPTPPITQFQVHIEPQTPPGFYDVRLVNRWGISNPRVFVVGDLGEMPEKEPNDDVDKAQRVPLNTTITGVIASPTDVDYYVFAGKKGQRVLVSCLASSIDSRLEAEVELYGPGHKRLVADHAYKGTDALADCTLPVDGDYHVRVCNYTYSAGSPEHFYRLSITTAPWIDAIHPCVLEPGKPTLVTVYGRNLPGGVRDPSLTVRRQALERATVTVTAPADPQARERLTYTGHTGPRTAVVNGFEYRTRNAVGVSNPFLLALATAPLTMAASTNTTPQSAQALTIPTEVAGRILTRGESDWYTFSAHKGETIAIDVFSDRLDANTDMFFLLRNAANHQDIAEVDTHSEALTNNFKFFEGTEDPGVYLFTSPTDSRYELMVSSRDAQSVFGVRHYYRLRLTHPNHDFHLVVMPPADSRPDGCQLLKGGHQLYTVLVWRHDGWDGPIELSVQGLPKGVTTKPQTLGPAMRQTSLVVSADPNAAPWTGMIHVKGTAMIDGHPVIRQARPASITWPVQPGSGIPAVSRMDHELALAVRDLAPFRLSATLDHSAVMQGGKANLTLKLTRLWPDFKGALTAQMAPQDAIPNVTLNNGGAITIPAGKDQAVVPVVVNPPAVPGRYNIVFRANGPIPFNKDPKAKQKPPVNVMQPAESVTLQVLPKEVATVNLANANPTIKAGARSEVIVRVTRLHRYKGPFKVKLVLPKGVSGLTAAETTIPAGKNEGRLVLNVPPKTPPGNRANVVVRLTAVLEGNNAAVQETRLNVNVVR